MVSRVYIGMGSNLGDGIANLLGAWERLAEEEGVTPIVLSSPYMTAPVDMTSQHWFTNGVGLLETTLTPLEMLQLLLRVEFEFGRRRSEQSFGYQDRSLDLDLLYFDDEMMDSPELMLPHPRIADRLFVLVPLKEIAPERRDVRSGLSVSEMEERLKSELAGQGARKQEIIKGSWQTILSD